MAYPSWVPNNPPSTIGHRSETGSVLLVVVLLVALLAAVVMGHLQINTEEIQLVQNHVGGAEAIALAEAGLNDALAQLRRDPAWCAGYTDKPLGGEAYSVRVDGSTVTAAARTARGFVAKIEAEITRGTGDAGLLVEVNKLRINQ
ncbi:MAG: hypothetical protein M1376_05135 [Planctomycetes bacterium]|nr:hypothetical protein [Planctomycetota bacterium]